MPGAGSKTLLKKDVYMFSEKWIAAVVAGAFGMALFAGAGNVFASEGHGHETVNVQTPKNGETCPVSGEKIGKKTGFTYEYKGKVYYLCCADCIKEFKKDPEKYSGKNAAQPAEEPMSHDGHHE